jgi:hypothetical protein
MKQGTHVEARGRQWRLSRLAWIATLTIAISGAPALAHHSFAMFDRSKTVVLNGTVKSAQWANPHTWFEIIAPGPDGVVQTWSIEGPSPNILIRMDWKPNEIQAGDRVTMTMNPRKDGSSGGVLVAVKLADGTTLRGSPPGVGGAPPDAGPPPGAATPPGAK